MPLDGPVAITIIIGVRAEFALIPERKLHRERGKERWFASTPAQAGANAEGAALVGDAEVFRRVIGSFVSGVMSNAAKNAVEGNQLSGIEQMVNAGGNFGAIPAEGFLGKIFALAHFGVAIGKTAAGQAEAEVGVLAERLA